MTDETIVIAIAPSGDVKIEGKGFKGGKCADATRPFEEALGDVTADRPTSQMYERESTAQVNANNG